MWKDFPRLSNIIRTVTVCFVWVPKHALHVKAVLKIYTFFLVWANVDDFSFEMEISNFDMRVVSVTYFKPLQNLMCT